VPDRRPQPGVAKFDGGTATGVPATRSVGGDRRGAVRPSRLLSLLLPHRRAPGHQGGAPVRGHI